MERIIRLASLLAAALRNNRKAKRGQHAVSCEGGATSSEEWSASNNVMNNSYLVQSILDFGGPGQHLYISTVSKLVRQCYAKVEANMFATQIREGKYLSPLV
jgi:hypothetical protein